jgi:2-polyprenyl-3-methyl-5-hydroxy-6-metoxy-1,4-benzoquinol methylase
MISKYHLQEIDLNVETSHSKLLRLVGTNKKVLEVGCATGYVSKVLKEQLMCSVTGIEVDPEAAKEAEKYCEKIIVSDIEDVDFFRKFSDEKFDVITFGDVLEHLKYPGRVLELVRPYLEDGGYVLASIPNIAHISVALELLNGRFDYRPLGLLDDTHLRFFTKKSILALFRNSGYEVVLWDRIILKPEETEFQTVLDSYPYSLLSFFESGSEALTYQFIVKAVPYSPDWNFVELHKEWEKTVLHELRSKLVEKGQQLAEKERQVEAILNTRSWKITAPLRWIYKNLRKEVK